MESKNDRLTWREIRDLLNSEDFPEDQLDAPAEILLETNKEPLCLHQIYGIDTVDKLCTIIDDDGEPIAEHIATRSNDDGEHHPERLVFHADKPSYSPEGDTFYELDFHESGKIKLIGNNTGRVIDYNET